MMTYRGLKLLLHVFLTSALHQSVYSTSCPTHFTSKERVLGTQQMEGWVDIKGEATNLFPYWELIPAS